MLGVDEGAKDRVLVPMVLWKPVPEVADGANGFDGRMVGRGTLVTFVELALITFSQMSSRFGCSFPPSRIYLIAPSTSFSAT